MRLRNWKETVAPTIEDTLRDVHPHTLEEGFHWYAPPGQHVWIKCGDEEGKNVKWRQGTIGGEGDMVFCPMGPFRTYEVYYTVKRKEYKVLMTPGLQPELKPDTPEVRELLRQDGVFI
ncbi:hypothetical protein BDQ12DRAFT_677700 [Crucibulum laeve]|uniref:Uncharacterized protein n=1 Tax=Crucibulum laeve TaxID=68775 RepID=A0A5C3MB74_9AGAR|nr:hypothetical protein BDQ12DRAFT_677700 [Crucibulum laeve]